MPPAAATALCLRAGLTAAGLLLVAACGRDAADPYVPLSGAAPAGGASAEVRVERCGTGWCEGLWVARANERPVRVTLLAKGERCDEIAWTNDGGRVAFLVEGHQLWLFDAAKQAPVGRVNLVEADATPTTRLARGVTFSTNGAAITFDDCPRGRSGCKPGMIAIR